MLIRARVVFDLSYFWRGLVLNDVSKGRADDAYQPGDGVRFSSVRFEWCYDIPRVSLRFVDSDRCSVGRTIQEYS